MSHLPVEIITEILSRLPVKSLLRFLCVSKSWYALIKHPDFIKLHLHRSIETNRDRTLILEKVTDGLPHYCYSVHFPIENHFDKAFKLYQPLYRRGKLVSILDCCHSLVCIHHFTLEIHHCTNEIAIWNPLIRKYRILPPEPMSKPSGFNFSKYNEIAFGYDLCNDDYKVLRVIAFYNRGQPLKEFEVKVYSLRWHSWRKIEEQWPKKECTVSSNSVSLNGVLHWSIAEDTPYDMDIPLGVECLLAFDLAIEKFLVFKTPVQREVELGTCLEVLKGQLCFIVTPDLGAEIDVWLMKEYGEAKKNRCEGVEIQNLPHWFRTATCVGSLLLLDGDNVIDPGRAEEQEEEMHYVIFRRILFYAFCVHEVLVVPEWDDLGASVHSMLVEEFLKNDS
ncbi:F-box protein CPR1-like [Quercus robur]|uniref:F-box protein CPR1-like n=1 Tax=Quercus robur TaxID=38942 RepID=UPI002161D1F1|nr:F-box protein CPR1-like [Quercus robur]